jgi:hypothetical protein
MGHGPRSISFQGLGRLLSRSQGFAAAPDLVAPAPKNGVASLSGLVRSSLRLRPDRIPIGEMRGTEAPLDLVKAWDTGHPGGIATIRAGSEPPRRLQPQWK